MNDKDNEWKELVDQTMSIGVSIGSGDEVEAAQYRSKELLEMYYEARQNGNMKATVLWEAAILRRMRYKVRLIDILENVIEVCETDDVALYIQKAPLGILCRVEWKWPGSSLKRCEATESARLAELAEIDLLAAAFEKICSRIEQIRDGTEDDKSPDHFIA